MSFEDFDIAAFWEQSDYATEEYVGEPVTEALVALVEKALGYKLPRAYVELMRHQNGGVPHNTCHRTRTRTTWANDHISITGIYAIGGSKPCSLCGQFGSPFMIEEWQYPPIGIYFADCPSAGHDMLCLDYRTCGPEGEPSVVHVDQERNYAITLVAENFEAFIRGLESDDAFELEDEMNPSI
jgi:SMI1-KNR4 cell-wall